MVSSIPSSESGGGVAVDTGATVIVTVPCCGADRPSRLVARDGDVLRVGPVRCPCRGTLEVGGVVTLSWTAGKSVVSAPARLTASAGPDGWRLRLDDAPRPLERRRFERVKDGRIAVLWHGRHMVPVRIEDRSAGGFRCIAGGRANGGLRVGDTVTLRVGSDTVVVLRVVRTKFIPGPQLELGLARV